jgi:hypothetical protein
MKLNKAKYGLLGSNEIQGVSVHLYEYFEYSELDNIYKKFKISLMMLHNKVKMKTASKTSLVLIIDKFLIYRLPAKHFRKHTYGLMGLDS